MECAPTTRNLNGDRARADEVTVTKIDVGQGLRSRRP